MPGFVNCSKRPLDFGEVGLPCGYTFEKILLTFGKFAEFPQV
jgi:hypothetical protein